MWTWKFLFWAFFKIMNSIFFILTRLFKWSISYWVICGSLYSWGSRPFHLTKLTCVELVVVVPYYLFIVCRICSDVLCFIFILVIHVSLSLSVLLVNFIDLLKGHVLHSIVFFSTVHFIDFCSYLYCFLPHACLGFFLALLFVAGPQKISVEWILPQMFIQILYLA